jgi:hypothetical protein
MCGPPHHEQVEPPPGEDGLLTVDARSARFIHAPSLNQATTAAILRSGSPSAQEIRATCSTSILSRRVRLAEWLSTSATGTGAGRVARLPPSAACTSGTGPVHCRFRRIAPSVSCCRRRSAEAAEAEAARLRALPHPESVVAEATAAARTRLNQLAAERATLPSRLPPPRAMLPSCGRRSGTWTPRSDHARVDRAPA